MGYVEGKKNFTANGDLPEKVRVKITAGSTTLPPQVEIAGDGEAHIGITEYAAESGDVLAVRLKNHTGTVEATAEEAFAVGAALYGAADGKVKDTVSGSPIGEAIEEATADGDIVEIYQYN